MTPETIYGFLAVIFLMFIGALIYAAGNYSARKKKGIPSYSGIVPMPPRKRPVTIIETQYGRDLLETSIRIYLRLNEQSGGSTRIKHAVEQAELLLNEVYFNCLQIDEKKREAAEKSNESIRNAMMDCKA